MIPERIESRVRPAALLQGFCVQPAWALFSAPASAGLRRDCVRRTRIPQAGAHRLRKLPIRARFCPLPLSPPSNRLCHGPVRSASMAPAGLFGSIRPQSRMTENAVECAVVEHKTGHADSATRRFARPRRAKGADRPCRLHIRPHFRSFLISPDGGWSSRRTRSLCENAPIRPAASGSARKPACIGARQRWFRPLPASPCRKVPRGTRAGGRRLGCGGGRQRAPFPLPGLRV